MDSLKEVALRHNEWLKLAKKVDAVNYEDIVQDLYIQLHKYFLEGKTINEWYILRYIKSRVIDKKRKEKNYKEVEIKIEIHEQIEDNIFTQLYDIEFKKLKKYEQVIIEKSSEEGIRVFSKKSGISIGTITTIRRKFKDKLWEEKRKLEELEM